MNFKIKSQKHLRAYDLFVGRSTTSGPFTGVYRSFVGLLSGLCYRDPSSLCRGIESARFSSCHGEQAAQRRVDKSAAGYLNQTRALVK